MIWRSMKRGCKKIINRCIELAHHNMDQRLKTFSREGATKSFPKSTLQIASVKEKLIQTHPTNSTVSTTQMVTIAKSVARALKTLCRWPRLCLLRASQEVVEWFNSPTQIRNSYRVSRIKGRTITFPFLQTRWIGWIILPGVLRSQEATREAHSCTQSRIFQALALPLPTLTEA